jgi:hypothetical protein
MTTIATFLTQGTLLVRWRHALLLAAGAMFRKPTDRWEVARREAADDAAAVRALAHSHRKSDPGFASDLYAAADRYEREHEAAVSNG